MITALIILAGVVVWVFGTLWCTRFLNIRMYVSQDYPDDTALHLAISFFLWPVVLPFLLLWDHTAKSRGQLYEWLNPAMVADAKAQLMAQPTAAGDAVKKEYVDTMYTDQMKAAIRNLDGH